MFGFSCYRVFCVGYLGTNFNMGVKMITIDQNCQLFYGDCLEVMKQIPDKSVDMILTDPPYLHEKGGMKSHSLNRGVRDANNKVISEMSNFGEVEINRFLDVVSAKMKHTNIFLFSSRLQIPFYLNWALKNKKQFDVLVWDKCHTGIINYHFYNPQVEYVIRIYERGLIKVNDPMLYQKVKRYKRPSNKLHPAEKPVKLLEDFIMVACEPFDVVLDPFMGSGTTGVACKNLGRKFVGIELDEKYFKTAENRIKGGLL